MISCPEISPRVHVEDILDLDIYADVSEVIIIVNDFVAVPTLEEGARFLISFVVVFCHPDTNPLHEARDTLFGQSSQKEMKVVFDESKRYDFHQCLACWPTAWAFERVVKPFISQVAVPIKR